MRFNLYERSFLSTSVIYFFVLLPLRVLTSDPFVLHAIVALTCNAVLLWVLARKDIRVWLLALGLLFASKAYFDYSWFGQENPIGHVLAAAIVLIWLRMYPDLCPGTRSDSPLHWRWFVAMVAVAPLYRHDFVMLVWPLAAGALWDNRIRLRAKGLTRSICWMLAPLFLCPAARRGIQTGRQGPLRIRHDLAGMPFQLLLLSYFPGRRGFAHRKSQTVPHEVATARP